MAKTDTSTVASNKNVAAAAPTQKFRQIVPADVHFDFVGKRKFFLILSTALNLVTLVLFFTRGFNLGTDFLGGTSMRIRFAQATSAADLRHSLSNLSLPDLSVQDFGG